MPKLILSIDDKFLDEFAINKDTVTIGRRTDNDICLDNLAISGYHTQITTVLNDSFLEDLNSTNGTFVNSKIVKKHALKDGDIIDIGNHRIKFINHLVTSSANSDFEQTVVMAPHTNQNILDDTIAELEKQIDAVENAQHEPNDASASEIATASVESTDQNSAISSAEDQQLEIATTKNKIARIQILSGSNCGKDLALNKSLTTIGKPNIAVIGITKRSNGYYIVHLDSSEDNVSKLNGEIIKSRSQPLEDHDIIDVAGIKLEFFVE